MHFADTLMINVRGLSPRKKPLLRGLSRRKTTNYFADTLIMNVRGLSPRKQTALARAKPAQNDELFCGHPYLRIHKSSEELEVVVVVAQY